MLQFWQDMKSAQFVDYQTRVLSFTLPVRANHLKVKNRLTMMLQLTSSGGVLPSFELQSRVDTVDYQSVFTILILNLALVIMFVVNELIEAFVEGFVAYFTKFVAPANPTIAILTTSPTSFPDLIQHVEPDGLVRLCALHATVH